MISMVYTYQQFQPTMTAANHLTLLILIQKKVNNLVFQICHLESDLINTASTPLRLSVPDP